MCLCAGDRGCERKRNKKCQEQSNLCLPDSADVPAPDSNPDSASVLGLQMLHVRAGPTLGPLELGEGNPPGLEQSEHEQCCVWRVQLSPGVLEGDNNWVLFHRDGLILATTWAVAGGHPPTQALPTSSMAHFG